MTPEYEAKIRAEERRRALEEAAQHFERWHAEESVVQNGNSDGDIWEETVSGIILGGPAIARELRKLASAPAPLHIPEKQEWAALIAAERRRQVEEEGWTPEHDDEHTDESLAAAASCYAWPDRSYPAEPPSRWQWEPQWWKPGPTRIRELVKAGALIAAEIDRLQRASVQLFPSPPEQDASHVEAVASRGETCAPGDPAPLTERCDWWESGQCASHKTRLLGNRWFCEEHAEWATPASTILCRYCELPYLQGRLCSERSFTLPCAAPESFYVATPERLCPAQRGELTCVLPEHHDGLHRTYGGVVYEE